jgi:hypothetical protein
VQVYAQLALRAEELHQLLAEAGLVVERMPEAGEPLTVVRGARARYSFTLGLPAAIDVEDVPAEITAELWSRRTSTR